MPSSPKLATATIGEGGGIETPTIDSTVGRRFIRNGSTCLRNVAANGNPVDAAGSATTIIEHAVIQVRTVSSLETRPIMALTDFA
ncbi:MAG TPA: hypothetical protein VNE58_16140 [Casimicrobiaceae bacterium]|nr:hypothetical protein [Casimicrobiaceae bacterium]